MSYITTEMNISEDDNDKKNVHYGLADTAWWWSLSFASSKRLRPMTPKVNQKVHVEDFFK